MPPPDEVPMTIASTSKTQGTVPVLVGCGEITERTRDPAQAQEPIALMTEALRRAAHDASSTHASALLAGIDSLDVVAEYSWPYRDACGLLSRRLEVSPVRCAYAEPGGDSPVRLLHEAALRIARGECQIAAVVGAEANYSVAMATKAGVRLPWTPRDPDARLLRGKDICHPLAVQHDMVQPAHVYPLYENAALAAWGQTPADALRESSELWSSFATVAAQNPYAWLTRSYSAEEIATPTAENRLIAWPYTKHMVANPLINQGAAVLLMSLSRARAVGIDEDRLIYLWGGARASETRDYLQRDRYDRSIAQETVLARALELAGGNVDRFGLVELYSCFPIVPKMARRTLGLPLAARLTATGGLSFFGAPLNNYMTHATAALMRHLRDHRGELALLYGQGEYVTKHHALVLGSRPQAESHLAQDYSVQTAVDRTRAKAPQLVVDYDGPASVETFTIIYDRDGRPSFGTVIVRTPQQARSMARVRADDAASLASLSASSASPIGLTGRVERGADSLLSWRVA